MTRLRAIRLIACSILALAGHAALCLAAPATAHAETPIYGAAELKFGGYYPAIDEEFGGSGPFQEIFGDDDLFYGELEVDYYLLQGFGKAGIGMHVGYTSVDGDVIAEDETDAEITDTTTFTVIPLRLSALYRFDVPAIEWGIPLVPAVKAGLDYYLWDIDDAAGDTAVADGEEGNGGTFGWHATVALHLLLDAIDPSTAAVFDLNWGVNNSYLFGEYMITTVDDFGGDSLDLSDDIWAFGLAFEF